MSFRRLLSTLVVLMLGMTALYADGVARTDGEAPPTPDARTFADAGCRGLPPNSRALPFKIISSYKLARADNLAAVGPPDVESRPIASVSDRQQIGDEGEYLRTFGEHSSGIDWSTSRILVVRLTTVYKLGQLESREALSGISQADDGIHVDLTFTLYGPCQGIAQKQEWFSREVDELFVLVPARPTQVFYTACIVGGCPPDIP